MSLWVVTDLQITDACTGYLVTATTDLPVTLTLASSPLQPIHAPRYKYRRGVQIACGYFLSWPTNTYYLDDLGPATNNHQWFIPYPPDPATATIALVEANALAPGVPATPPIPLTPTTNPACHCAITDDFDRVDQLAIICGNLNVGHPTPPWNAYNSFNTNNRYVAAIQSNLATQIRHDPNPAQCFPTLQSISGSHIIAASTLPTAEGAVTITTAPHTVISSTASGANGAPSGPEFPGPLMHATDARHCLFVAYTWDGPPFSPTNPPQGGPCLLRLNLNPGGHVQGQNEIYMDLFFPVTMTLSFHDNLAEVFLDQGGPRQRILWGTPDLAPAGLRIGYRQREPQTHAVDTICASGFSARA